jgi:3-hydroxyacyl-CoA dehydrogenase
MGDIKRAAVLGSGVMGGAIAAHLANCGIPSLMLDIVPPGLSADDRRDPVKRNAFAAASKAALLKAKPAPLYLPENADLIEIGNFEDDFPRIAEADWVIEVVKEDLAVKKKVLVEAAKHRRPGSIISTNTSGILIQSMVDGLDEDMRRHFLGAHFFNPPRYLPLLELIPGPDTLPELLASLQQFAENVLGKGIVVAKDTPNFVANRILTYVCQYIMREFSKDGLSVDDVDRLTGPIIGHASSATFRTCDLVGLDTYVHVIGNVYRGCPGDEQRELFQPEPWLQQLVDENRLGEKTGAGFYKKTDERDEKGKRVILSLNVDTLEYEPPRQTRFDCISAARATDDLEERVRIMHTGEDAGSKFVWKLFANTAIYAANRIPEIADDIVSIDRAVKWGFAWNIGIFETWDALGFEYVCERMAADGFAVPALAQALRDAGGASFYRYENGRKLYFDLASKGYKDVERNPNALFLLDLKRGNRTVQENEACSLIDLGDGILCAEFHTKMNTIDADLLELLNAGTARVNEGAFDGMVVANQGEHFSAGANLFLVLGYAMQNDWDALDQLISAFQDTNMALRFCRGPVVAAPHHYTFGGGIELSQHAARVVAAAETYGGLVEAGVGIIPAGGGTKEMLRRALAYVPDSIPQGDPFPYLRRAFETIGMAKVSTSGPELIPLGYLTEHDFVCVNGQHQVKRAKDVCRSLVLAGYTPPRPAKLTVLGEPVRAAFRSAVYQMQLAGWASEHDALITEYLARTLTGGDRLPGQVMSEQDALDLEREAMLYLCGTEKTRARMQHMLKTGKPLRN